MQTSLRPYLDPCSLDALTQCAETDLNIYAAAKERESAARDLLRHAIRRRQQVFQQYLRSYDALKKHPNASETLVVALQERLQAVQSNGQS